MQRPVQHVGEVLDLARRLDRIDHPVFGREVDPDRHPIASQHLLADDVERLPLQVDQLRLHHAARRPETVHARPELALERAVHEDEARLAVADRNHRDMRELARFTKPPQQHRLDRRHVGDVDRLGRPRASRRPHDELRVGPEYGIDAAVPLDDGDLGARGPEHRQVLCDDIRELVEQRLFIGRGERAPLQFVPLELQPVLPRRKAVFARTQNAAELALVEVERTLVFLDKDAPASQ